MRRSAILVFCVLSGCALPQSEPVKRCETVLLATLKAPSSYKLIEVVEGQPDKVGNKDVFLTYDAVNSYNAPIRDTFACAYNLRSGLGRDKSSDYEAQAEAEIDKIEREVDKALNERNAPVAQRPNPILEPKQKVTEVQTLDEIPVCDRPDSPEKTKRMAEIGVDCLGE